MRAFGAGLLVLLAGCGATVSQERYRVDLAQQQASFEARLREREQARRREAQTWSRNQQTAEQTHNRLSRRLASAERHLVDAQGQIERAADARPAPRNARTNPVNVRLTTPLSRVVEVLQDRQGTRVLRLAADLLFQPGSARVRPQSAELINAVAALIRSLDGHRCTIRVHGDNIRTTANGAQGDALTDRQALSLVHALFSAGVAEDRLAFESFGEYRPLASNDSEDGRARNRRIEFALHP